MIVEMNVYLILFVVIFNAVFLVIILLYLINIFEKVLSDNPVVRINRQNHELFDRLSALLKDVADIYDLNILGQLPLDSELTKLSDMGAIEEYQSEWIEEFDKQVKEL